MTSSVHLGKKAVYWETGQGYYGSRFYESFLNVVQGLSIFACMMSGTMGLVVTLGSCGVFGFWYKEKKGEQ